VIAGAGVIAGEGQEDLVEGRPAHADLIDGYRRVAEAADHRCEFGCPAGGRSAGAPPAAVKPGRVGGNALEDLADRIEPGWIGDHDLDDIATLAFRSPRVPDAMARPWSITEELTDLAVSFLPE
jgi:hypothetical protein